MSRAEWQAGRDISYRSRRTMMDWTGDIQLEEIEDHNQKVCQSSQLFWA